MRCCILFNTTVICLGLWESMETFYGSDSTFREVTNLRLRCVSVVTLWIATFALTFFFFFFLLNLCAALIVCFHLGLYFAGFEA